MGVDDFPSYADMAEAEADKHRARIRSLEARNEVLTSALRAIIEAAIPVAQDVARNALDWCEENAT